MRVLGYVMDRQRALWAPELVAVLRIRQRGARSLLLLSDGSLQRSTTRPRTWRRMARVQLGCEGVAWQKRR